MDLGLCSEEIKRPSIDETLKAISGYGFKTVQFNLWNVYGEEVPPADMIDPAEMLRIGKLAENLGLEIIGLNATFNMLESNPAILKQNLKSFEKMAGICGYLGENCRMMSLCTGSRNPYSRWFGHPFNQTQEAWDICKSVAAELVGIAEKYDVYLGVEAEVINVVNGPEKARRLLDEVGSSRLKIILDIANMVNEGEATREDIERITFKAFDLLGDDIVVAHGKDIKGGPGMERTSAGRGILDFALIIRLLQAHGYKGSMVLHHMEHESAIPDSYAYMKKVADQTL